MVPGRGQLISDSVVTGHGILDANEDKRAMSVNRSLVYSSTLIDGNGQMGR